MAENKSRSRTITMDELDKVEDALDILLFIQMGTSRLLRDYYSDDIVCGFKQSMDAQIDTLKAFARKVYEIERIEQEARA